jgi:hypothetical protein
MLATSQSVAFPSMWNPSKPHSRAGSMLAQAPSLSGEGGPLKRGDSTKEMNFTGTLIKLSLSVKEINLGL